MLKAGVSNLKKDDSEPVLGLPRWRSPGSRKESKVLDTTMRVKTPENISFEYQLAGPFRRIFAYFFDIGISLGGYLILVVFIYVLVSIVILPISARFGGGPLVQAIMGILGGMVSVGWFIVLWFYGAFMEARFNGQTLGKRITKMRVIATDGHAIDGVQATLRNFFRLLDVMPAVSIAGVFAIELSDSPVDPILTAPLLPTCLFGLIVMTLSRRYQRVGDLVANTVVVNEEQKRMPNLATFLDERVPRLAELIPNGFVVPASMARSVADYVDQRKYLPFQRASEIAGHLAIPLMEKFGMPRDTDHDLFICSLYYKTFVSEQADDDDQVLLPGQHAPGRSFSSGDTDAPESKGLKMDPSDFRIGQ